MRQTERLDFPRIREIAHQAFAGSELPNDDALRFNYDNGEVFTQPFYSTTGTVASFAIVVSPVVSPLLWMIATDMKVRGLGYAGDLLDEIVDYYKGKADKITLTVKADNIGAQRLYLDYGFIVTNVLPKHYGVETGLRMRRTLS